MEKIKKSTLINLIALESQLPKKDVEVIFDKTFEIMLECLSKGYNVGAGQLGTFKLKRKGARPERFGMVNVHTKEMGMLPALDEYNRVVFSPSIKTRTTIREKTIGNIYE